MNNNNKHYTLVLYLINDDDILKTLYQIVSIMVYSKYKNIEWAIILPESQKEILNEFFYYEFNFIKLNEIASKKYFYSPDIDQISVINSIDTLQHFNHYDYIILGDNLPEFKDDNMSMMEYIIMKNEIIKQIHVSTHDYILSQINIIDDLEMKIVILFLNSINMNEVKNIVMKSLNKQSQNEKSCKYIIMYDTETITKVQINQEFNMMMNYTVIDMHNTDRLTLMTIAMLASIMIGELNTITYNALFNDCKMFITTDIHKKFKTHLVQSVKLYDMDQNVFFPNMKSMIKYV